MPIPVLVVGGYLGAGKSTLVNAVLRSFGEPVGVLVNDFGSIGIDGALVENRNGDTIELANGCVCCTLSGGIASALDVLARREVPPSLILVEASGVSNPAKVAQYAKAPGFTLDGVVVLVDAESVRERADDRLVGRDVRRQIVAADLLILNKIDLVDSRKRADVRAWLSEVAGPVPIVEAEYGRVPLHVLTGSSRGEPSSPDAPAESDRHAQRYATWSFERYGPLERDALSGFLAALPSAVLRGKGVVQLRDDADRRYVVQLVGRRVSVRLDRLWGAEPPVSRIVLIAAVDDSFVSTCDALALRYFA